MIKNKLNKMLILTGIFGSFLVVNVGATKLKEINPTQSSSNENNVNLSKSYEKKFTPKEFVKYALKKLEKDGIFYSEKDKTICYSNVTINENESKDIVKRILDLYLELQVKNYKKICDDFSRNLLNRNNPVDKEPITFDENFYDKYIKDITYLKSPVKEIMIMMFEGNDGKYKSEINVEETEEKKKRNYNLLKRFNTKEADKCAFILTVNIKCLNKIKEKDGKYEFENIDFLSTKKEKIQEIKNINSITKESVNILNSLKNVMFIPKNKITEKRRIENLINNNYKTIINNYTKHIDKSSQSNLNNNIYKPDVNNFVNENLKFKNNNNNIEQYINYITRK